MLPWRLFYFYTILWFAEKLQHNNAVLFSSTKYIDFLIHKFDLQINMSTVV